MNIVFCNGKGGSGKSTLCFLTALALREAGRSARVIDADPQGSLGEWLGDQGDADHGSGAITLTDLPPRLDGARVFRAIEGADLVVIPAAPSPADLLAVRATVETVRAHLTKRARALVVLNRVRSNTTLSGGAREIVARIGLPIANTEIPERQAIQRALVGGWHELDTATRETVLALALEIVTP